MNNKIWKVVIVCVAIVAAVLLYLRSTKTETAAGGGEQEVIFAGGAEDPAAAGNGTPAGGAAAGAFSEEQKEELRAIVRDAVSETLTEQMETGIRASLETCLDRMLEEGRLDTAVSRYAEVQNQLINVNTAGQEELVKLNGIGEAKARAIIAYREEHGPFSAIEDLMNVSGISTGTLEKFREQVTL